MKKIHLILGLIYILSFQYIRAVSVSENEAINHALTFLSCDDSRATIDVFSVSGKADMYKVITNKGWVLLSTEKAVKPILAYSLVDPFPDIEDMPDGMKWLFSSYEDAISYAKQHPENLNVHNEWENDEDIHHITRNLVLLSRLKDVKWGQCRNNDYSCLTTYNKFCPTFHNSCSCGNTLAGCGAVALGQVLWYYQWPHWGLIPEQMLNDNGLVSSSQIYKFYNWNLMPDSISSTTPTMMVDEIAAFLRDCGYAEHMEYGPNVSNTYVDSIRHALIHNVGYTNVLKKSRSSYGGDWVVLMKRELLNGRPIIYRGGNPNGGHFFILHGFAANHFVINWGWNGNWNSTFCTLDSLNVGGTHYNDGHYALINIAPVYPTCSPITIPSSDVWNNNFLVKNGGGINIGNRTVTNTMQGGIISGDYIRLTSGFQINEGANVLITIRDMHCNNSDELSVSSESEIIKYAPQKRDEADDTPQMTKFIRDGQLFILRDGILYNAQ